MSARKTVTKRLATVAKRLRAPRGQATVEYSLVSHAILLGGALPMIVIMNKLFDAFSTFYASIYFVLNSGAI